MLQIISLSLVSLGMMAALFMMARHNQKTGWRRQRTYLAEDIQQSMDALLTHVTEAVSPVTASPVPVLTPEASLSFSSQLATLQSTLSLRPSVAPAPQTQTERVEVFAAKA